MRDFHNTPTQFYMPGVAGPWFDTRVNLSSLSAPSAIVIQFDSSRHFSLSHNTMEKFFQEVVYCFILFVVNTSHVYVSIYEGRHVL